MEGFDGLACSDQIEPGLNFGVVVIWFHANDARGDSPFDCATGEWSVH
jgi:hypothetical protein